MPFYLYNKPTTTKDVVDDRREKVTNLYRFQVERRRKSQYNKPTTTKVVGKEEEESYRSLQIQMSKNQKSQYNISRDNEDSEDSQSCSASH